MIALAGFGAAYVLAVIPALIWRLLPKQVSSASPRPAGPPSRLVWIISSLSSVVFLGLCSLCSPLYPFNTWEDSNCFLTVGRGILHGLIPYRDLVEQKGPILYFLHTAAALVSETSFLGVFLLELAAAVLFLYFTYRTLELLLPGASPFWIVPTAALVYSCDAFCLGDSAEEFCLPLLAYGLYIGLKGMQERSFPSSLACFWIGVASGCIFWIKYTIVGLYLGWFFAFCLLALIRREFFQPVKMGLWILAGVFLVTLPILGYFAWNQALSDLLITYFYNNIFHYSEGSSYLTGLPLILGNIRRGLVVNALPNIPIFLLATVIGFLGLARQRRYLQLTMALSAFGGMVFFLYMGGALQQYYCLVLVVFFPLGLAVLLQMFRNLPIPALPTALRLVALGCAGVLCLVWANNSSMNTPALGSTREDYPQFRFAQIMGQQENPTLLNYGFLDGGFYTVAGILPNCPNFCTLNIPIAEYQETQDTYLQNGWVDFVVTMNNPLDLENYECIEQFQWIRANRTYYLYQLKK